MSVFFHKFCLVCYAKEPEFTPLQTKIKKSSDNEVYVTDTRIGNLYSALKTKKSDTPEVKEFYSSESNKDNLICQS